MFSFWRNRAKPTTRASLLTAPNWKAEPADIASPGVERQTGKKNIRIELLFLALGFNLKKRRMKQQKRRLETYYSKKKAA